MKLIYIGTTSNLKTRLLGHIIMRIIRAVVDDDIIIKYKIIQDMHDRLDLEKRLIKRLQPRGNVVGRNHG
jgi:excinuclease UvrABC nuclease subunit